MDNPRVVHTLVHQRVLLRGFPMLTGFLLLDQGYHKDAWNMPQYHGPSHIYRNPQRCDGRGNPYTADAHCMASPDLKAAEICHFWRLPSGWVVSALQTDSKYPLSAMLSICSVCVASIVRACYLSQVVPQDPLCKLTHHS